jgi:hypothetical protein
MQEPKLDLLIKVYMELSYIKEHAITGEKTRIHLEGTLAYIRDCIQRRLTVKEPNE